jgi:hypothetical protein
MDEELSQLSPGLYVDSKGALYLKMGEFLLAHHLPDLPEVRQAIRDEILREFGDVPVKELE